MFHVISHFIITFQSLLLFINANAIENYKSYKRITLNFTTSKTSLYNHNISKNKISIKVFIADTLEKQRKGLSGIKILKHKTGMLFKYNETKNRIFWMIDTYINLDIFFLDKNLKITAVERNLKAHPGRRHKDKIRNTKPHLAKYVLELASKDLVSKKLTVGAHLFTSSLFIMRK